MDQSPAACPARLSRHDAYYPDVPHELFADLRRESPVCWHQATGEPGFWAIFKYRDVVEISTATEAFSSERGVFVEDIATGQGIPGSLLTTDPPRHTRMREQFNNWFTAPAVSKLEKWLREESRKIMQEARTRDRTEFVYDMAAKLPLLTICEFLGVPDGDRDRMLELGDVVVRSQDSDAFAAAMGEIGNYGLALAGRSTDQAQSPLVQEMRRSLSQSDAEFSNQFSQLLVAGNETTRTLLSNIVLELCARPDLFRELKGEPKALPLAIEEFLRWTSPIYYMRRTATRPFTLRDHRIAEGDAVVMYYVSANRDEDAFADADVLDIRRRPNRHLAFGVGRHNCLGAQLARLETRVFLEEMFATFSGVELLEPPRRFPSNVVNSWESISVAFQAER